MKITSHRTKNGNGITFHLTEDEAREFRDFAAEVLDNSVVVQQHGVSWVFRNEPLARKTAAYIEGALQAVEDHLKRGG